MSRWADYDSRQIQPSFSLVRYDMPDEIRTAERLSELLRPMLAEFAVRLEVPAEGSRIQQAINDAAVVAEPESTNAICNIMMRAAQSVGIRVAPMDLNRREVWELLLDNFPIGLMSIENGRRVAWVFSNVSMGSVDATRITERDSETNSISKRQLNRILQQGECEVFLIAEPSLVCQAITTSVGTEIDGIHRVASKERHADSHEHHHISPFQRMTRMLRLESRDILSLVVFGIVVSVLDLATPLAVEQMVTTIGFASLVQPLIWIAVLLFSILTLSAIIKALQFFIIEILQRRLFVRIVGDLSARLPRLERDAMDGIYGPEMANRFFDVMTIQKATASLLIEGLSLIIQTITGLLLLAIYSPFLLVFDIVLVLCMTAFIYLLGRNSVKTAIEESLIKYRIAHWLQDVIGNPGAFQVHGGAELSVDRANRLTVEYLTARRKHFAVLMRQTLFALMLYAVSISTLLSLGGYLVLSNSLTMGQLVASVSVVAVVVGAFSKIGKSLESFYDLMSAFDKVGHLIDLPNLTPSRSLKPDAGPVDVRLRNLAVHGGNHHTVDIGDLHIPKGGRFALTGEGECGKTVTLLTLCGLKPPQHGLAEIGGIDSREVNRFADGSMVSLAGPIEVFHGSMIENISMNRSSISSDDIRHALQTVELWNEALELGNGLETMLQSGGYPLSGTQAVRLMLARAIVGKPRLLLVDGLLDQLPPTMRKRIWDRIAEKTQPWTIVVVTHDDTIIRSCDDKKSLA